MKPKERDDLLITISSNIGRLKEGLANIWRSTEAQEKHLEKINNHLANHSERLNIVETKVEERTTSRVSRKVLTGYGGVVLIVVTLIYYLGQARGWW